MNIKPLLEAGPAIQLHVAAAAFAVMLSVAIIVIRRGTPAHKRIGRAWVAMLALICISSFWITGMNGSGYSWIHLLSAWTLLGLCKAVWAVRTGHIRIHKYAMISTMIGALLGAGFFAFMPGRMMSAILFG
ncbi:hypothetical protein [Anderseniella sp. Alg231-50]|uniref:hypothetical protein n=1 Tax=Anderseniella sp. Alg231-50 TaxID=1922226 RepID=UPI000D558DD8